MDVKGLVKRMRNEFLNDTEGCSEDDYRWKTTNLIAALNSAEREISRRLLLLEDSTTAATCLLQIALVDGAFPRTYALDSRVLRVERMLYPGVARPLTRKTAAELDSFDPGWQGMTGTPSAFTNDLDSGKVTFNRQPVKAGVAMMTVKRLPLQDLTQDGTPEVRQYDDELIHGGLAYAYLKDDKQTFDPARASVWRKQFETDIRQIERDRAALSPRPMVMRPERF